MEKEKRVVEFYVLCNRLKDLLRTGWKQWGVPVEKVESVAEHIFGTQMLAVAMWSEFDYKLDIKNVLCMLALHETEEILIGDLTPFEISKEEKQKLGKQVVKQIFGGLKNGKMFEELLDEFNDRKTFEAKFAFWCDKLECDLQCKLYDEQNLVDLKKQQNNKDLNNPKVQKLLSEEKTWSGAWMRFGKIRYDYDENFSRVSDFAKENKISKNN